MQALKAANDSLIVFATTPHQRLNGVNGANINATALSEARERGTADERACHHEGKAAACATVSWCSQ